MKFKILAIALALLLLVGCTTPQENCAKSCEFDCKMKGLEVAGYKCAFSQADSDCYCRKCNWFSCWNEQIW